MSKTPGENLRLMRELAGMSQPELAKAAGIKHHQQISHMETGHRNIGPSTKKRLAAAFNLPVEEFFRLIHSEGDPEVIKLWLKLHEIKDKSTCTDILTAFSNLIDLYNLSTEGPIKDAFKAILEQIRSNLEISKKSSK